ncbi:putative flavin-containing monooxygenase [Gordonia effusa NBRC 100432]|uniref:Putative flavin-containing monooxygenase n=1 Tax=Gordonia effusa NBRC 100432 TaxID=1077974 RepID=H0QXJ4_9ACTN|nr:NAD(P)/FAD-dependent oxidoreductase [Gordonia effusa]GAB17545.1 putative flavin-containing monooxygenase [Gordonia effusa NBRC 100432]
MTTTNAAPAKAAAAKPGAKKPAANKPDAKAPAAAPAAAKSPSKPITPDYEVAIVGAGFGGLGAAIRLKDIGVTDIVILEKHDGVGGCWWANTYPGVAVDVPSLVYSFSFDQRTDWSRVFAPGSELRKYAQSLVDKNDLGSKLRLNTGAKGGRWDEDNHIWHVETEQGDKFTARFVIAAVGGLEIPRLPDIPDIEKYEGKVMHSAQWDHEYSLEGKNVAVIGTGASALQLVPEVAKIAGHLTVFQRRGIWAAPKPDWKVGPFTQFVLNRIFLRKIIRFVAGGVISLGVGGGVQLAKPWMLPFATFFVKPVQRAWIWANVGFDWDLAKRLTPNYPIGCKRPSVSNKYFPTFKRPNVTLVTDPITRGDKKGLVTGKEDLHEFDAIICATGFQVAEPSSFAPFRVVGYDAENTFDDEEVVLHEYWEKYRMQAYQGVSGPFFPNAFMTTGPYGYAPSSYHSYIEAACAHIVRAIKETKKRGATRIEVKKEPHLDYWHKCVQKVEKTGYRSACRASNTFYINSQGDSALVRPEGQFTMWWQNRFYNKDVYKYDTLPNKGA